MWTKNLSEFDFYFELRVLGRMYLVSKILIENFCTKNVTMFYRNLRSYKYRKSSTDMLSF